jgi:hypothetical protein
MQPVFARGQRLVMKPGGQRRQRAAQVGSADDVIEQAVGGAAQAQYVDLARRDGQPVVADPELGEDRDRQLPAGQAHRGGDREHAGGVSIGEVPSGDLGREHPVRHGYVEADVVGMHAVVVGYGDAT